jgi:hypothetical protein
MGSFREWFLRMSLGVRFEKVVAAVRIVTISAPTTQFGGRVNILLRTP